MQNSKSSSRLANLNVVEWHVEGERLVVVGVEGVFFNCRLFLLDSASLQH